MKTSGSHGLRAAILSTTGILLAVVCVVSVAAAQTVTTLNVNCDQPNNPPLSYNFITRALNSVDWNAPAVEIIVTGTCKERVEIGDGRFARNSIYIHPPAGQRATLVPPVGREGTGVQITIGGAHGIALERLDISGASIGLDIYDSSEVDTYDLTIEDNSSVGVRASGNSIVYFSSSRIRDNGKVGVDVSGQGASTVYLRGGQESPNPTVVEGNGIWGINAGTAGVIWMDAFNIVRNNGGAATIGTHGGIHATRNSAVSIIKNDAFGATEITGNTGPGILAEVNSSVTLLGANIHANLGEGVKALTKSVLELVGPNTFASNGVANISCDVWSLLTGDLTGIDLKTIACKNIDLTPK